MYKLLLVELLLSYLEPLILFYHLGTLFVFTSSPIFTTLLICSLLFSSLLFCSLLSFHPTFHIISTLFSYSHFSYHHFLLSFFRAIKLNLSLFRWGRALDLAVKYRSHVDTVLGYRQKHLDEFGKVEKNAKFLQYAGQVRFFYVVLIDCILLCCIDCI